MSTGKLAREMAEKAQRFMASFRSPAWMPPKPITEPEMPPTIFRCGKCGKVVARYDPNGANRKYRVPPGEPFTCKVHGAFQEVDYDEWQGEWERRGRPARLNWRLPPVQ